MKWLFPPAFTIRISHGEARLKRGKLTSSFLKECSGIAGQSGLDSGWIWGCRQGNRISLEFSPGIGRRERQRFRNLAGMHEII